MALRWFLHSACHFVGHPKVTNMQSNNDVVGYPNETRAMNGAIESSKASDKAGLSQMEMCSSGFQMPLHYPRYTKADYEKMEEWKVDMLLREYGLNLEGTIEEKRAYAIGAFLWPDQY